MTKLSTHMSIKTKYHRLSYMLSLGMLSIYSSLVNASVNSCEASYQLKTNSQSKFTFQQASVTRHKFNSFFSMKPLSNTIENLPTKVKLPEGVVASWWGFQLTEVTQQANRQPLPEELIYSLPFAVLRTSEGNIVDFRFPVDISVEEQDKLKGFTYYLQFPIQQSAITSSYSRKEYDGIGEFTAL